MTWMFAFLVVMKDTIIVYLHNVQMLKSVTYVPCQCVPYVPYQCVTHVPSIMYSLKFWI